MTRRLSPPEAVQAASDAAPEPRASRRKRRTRARLLRGALELMAERDVEFVAINEITEAADVGFGTFYNYFDSKEAIHNALVQEVVETFGSALDQIATRVEDPAEVLAASVRYTLKRASKEPMWGRFLIRVGLSARPFEQGLGPRLLRDLEKGIALCRFQTADLPMAVVGVRGVLVSAMDAQIDLAQHNSDALTFAVSLGLDEQNVPERTAAMLLRLLGLDVDDAEEVANRPLPDIELPADLTQPSS